MGFSGTGSLHEGAAGRPKRHISSRRATSDRADPRLRSLSVLIGFLFLGFGFLYGVGHLPQMSGGSPAGCGWPPTDRLMKRSAQPRQSSRVTRRWRPRRNGAQCPGPELCRAIAVRVEQHQYAAISAARASQPPSSRSPPTPCSLRKTSAAAHAPAGRRSSAPRRTLHRPASLAACSIQSPMLL